MKDEIVVGYRSQAIDTHPEVDRLLIRALRNTPFWKKAHLLNEATRGLRQ